MENQVCPPKYQLKKEGIWRLRGFALIRVLSYKKNKGWGETPSSDSEFGIDFEPHASPKEKRAPSAGEFAARF